MEYNPNEFKAAVDFIHRNNTYMEGRTRESIRESLGGLISKYVDNEGTEYVSSMGVTVLFHRGEGSYIEILVNPAVGWPHFDKEFDVYEVP